MPTLQNGMIQTFTMDFLRDGGTLRTFSIHANDAENSRVVFKGVDGVESDFVVTCDNVDRMIDALQRVRMWQGRQNIIDYAAKVHLQKK